MRIASITQPIVVALLVCPAGWLVAQDEEPESSASAAEESEAVDATIPDAPGLDEIGDALSLDELGADFGLDATASISADANTDKVQEGDAPERIPFTGNALFLAQLAWTLDAPFAFGLAHAAGNFAWDPIDELQFFGDASLIATIPEATVTPILNQVGIRLRPTSWWNIGIGIERRLDAAALFITPSDFVFADENIPGDVVQRLGVWGIRNSFIFPRVTVDLLILPFPDVDGFNLPNLNNWEFLDVGWVARTRISLAIMDLGFSGGWVDRSWQASLFASGYVTDFWELHGEVAYQSTTLSNVDKTEPNPETGPLFGEREHVVEALIGTRFEFGETGILIFEALYLGGELTPDEFNSVYAPAVQAALQDPTLLLGASQAPSQLAGLVSGLFVRRWYAIVSGGVSGLADLFNLNATALISLEDGSTTAFLRGDWLVTTSHGLAATLGLLAGPPGSQNGILPIHWFLTADWQFNF